MKITPLQNAKIIFFQNSPAVRFQHQRFRKSETKKKLMALEFGVDLFFKPGYTWKAVCPKLSCVRSHLSPTSTLCPHNLHIYNFAHVSDSVSEWSYRCEFYSWCKYHCVELCSFGYTIDFKDVSQKNVEKGEGLEKNNCIVSSLSCITNQRIYLCSQPFM